jgi:hypothetical protein
MPTDRVSTNKPEKRDFKQEFLDMVAKQSGPLTAARLETAIAHEKKQMEQAMMEGGATLTDVAGVIAQQVAPPQIEETEKKKGNFWYTPFQMNKQTGEVTPASILGGLISQNPRDVQAMASANRMGGSMGGELSPEEAALKIKQANEALAAQGLEGYEAKTTAKGGISASKPSSYATATSPQKIQAEIEGMANGTIPPDPQKFTARRDITNVVGGLAQKGLDLKQLALDYQAEQSFVKSINSTQQLRLRQLIPSVLNGIDDLDKLNEDFKRTGIKAFNKASLEYYANGGGSKEQQQIAQKFTSQMTVLADEMGSIFMGGNTPTDRSLDMAQKLFRGDFNDTALKASNEQVKRNLGYRANAIESVSAVGTKGTLSGTVAGGKKKEQRSFNSEEEALASGIKGEVTINGRPARID